MKGPEILIVGTLETEEERMEELGKGAVPSHEPLLEVSLEEDSTKPKLYKKGTRFVGTYFKKKWKKDKAGLSWDEKIRRYFPAWIRDWLSVPVRAQIQLSRYLSMLGYSPLSLLSGLALL